MPQQGNAASYRYCEFWSEMAVPSSAGIRALEGNTRRKCHSTLRQIGRLCRWHGTNMALRNLLTQRKPPVFIVTVRLRPRISKWSVPFAGSLSESE